MILAIALFLAIVIIFSYSMHSLLSKGRVLLLPNLIQPFLFTLLYYQIFIALGKTHYQFDVPPAWYDWLQFTGVHILRAADILDFLEEYKIDLQNIKHNSALSGIVIIIMHWMVDIFLIAWIIRRFKERMGALWKWWEKWAGAIKIISLWMIAGFAAAYGITAYLQSWRMWDIFLLWPLDSLIRTLDIGDTFQIFGWHLHQVERSYWNSSLAVFFRLGCAYWAGYYINVIRLKKFKGMALSIEDLIDNLAHSDKNVRKSAALALVRIGPGARETIPALVKALDDKDKYVRRTAVAALGKIGQEAREAIPALAKALADHSEGVRGRAAEALGNIGPEAKEAIPALVKALADQDRWVRGSAAEALGSIILEWQVREAIAEALEKRDPQWHKSKETRKAVPALVAQAAALGKIGQEARQAVPDLVKALADWRKDVSEAAAEALKKIRGG